MTQHEYPEYEISFSKLKIRAARIFAWLSSPDRTEQRAFMAAQADDGDIYLETCEYMGMDPLSEYAVDIETAPAWH